MGRAEPKRMTEAEFLAWEPGDEGRYELVDGLPVAMTGARSKHDRVVVAALLVIGAQLRGKPCRPSTADIAVRIPNGNLRRPDLTVDCGRPDPDDMVAAAPTLVVEVLSPSTRQRDLLRKALEYKTVPTITDILFVDPDETAVIWHHRADGAVWSEHDLTGADTRLAFPVLGLDLTLADLYPTSG